MSLQPYENGQYTRISGTAAGTTVVCPHNSNILRVVFNQNQTGTATLYDTATGAGTTSANTILVANNNVGSIPTALEVGCRTKNGIVAVYGGTVDLTVIWN
jgi:hypothetical protein